MDGTDKKEQQGVLKGHCHLTLVLNTLFFSPYFADVVFSFFLKKNFILFEMGMRCISRRERGTGKGTWKGIGMGDYVHTTRVGQILAAFIAYFILRYIFIRGAHLGTRPLEWCFYGMVWLIWFF